MKKIIAILLSLALLLGCAAGLAEETEKQSLGTIRVNGEFTLKGILPDGYEIWPIEMNDDEIFIRIVSEDETRPEMLLSIAYDETYSRVERMNDLDDEGLAILEETFTNTDPYANIYYDETAYGTRLLIARTQSEVYDSLDIFSIYKGYCVEFVMSPGKKAKEQKLTDEEVAKCIAFLSELDFVEGTETAEVPVEGKSFTASITGFDAVAKTIDVTLYTPVVLADWNDATLKEGDTVTIGAEQVEVVSIRREENETVLNDEYYIIKNDNGEYNAYFYDSPILETVRSMTVPIGDQVVFIEGIEPLSGEPLEEKATKTAEDLFAALEAANNDGVRFDSENILITFDENGEVTEVERDYAPWQ